MAIDNVAAAIDRHLHLMGYEDCDVDVQCSECWDGGRPIIFYDRYSANPYDPALVTTARTIGELWELMAAHVRDVHGVTS